MSNVFILEKELKFYLLKTEWIVIILGKYPVIPLKKGLILSKPGVILKYVTLMMVCFLSFCPYLPLAKFCFDLFAYLTMSVKMFRCWFLLEQY